MSKTPLNFASSADSSEKNSVTIILLRNNDEIVKVQLSAN